MLALIEYNFPNHGPNGAPDLGSWPHARSRTHQQMHVKWLRQAYDAGQRVMIASVTDNEVLEKWYHYVEGGPDCDVFPPDPAFAMQAALKQIDAIKQLVNDNSSWLHLADTPEDAFDAAFPLAGPGKLVLILGLELDALSVNDTLDLIDNEQVRSVIPIHLVNNEFGGAAVYDNLFNTVNHWQEGNYFQIVNDTTLSFELDPPQHLNASYQVTSCAIQPRRETEVNPSFTYDEVTCSGDPDGGHRNARGISDFDGIFSLMERGILLDLSHMGWASKADTLGYAEGIAGLSAWGGYPVIDSHTELRDESAPPTAVPEVNERALSWAHAKRIQKLGGVVGFGTVGDPGLIRLLSGPGREEAEAGHGRNDLVRLTGEGREFIAYPKPNDERPANDELHELRVRVRTGGDNLENDSAAHLLIDAFGTVHEFLLKEASVGETWNDWSIHEVIVDQTVIGTSLASLGIKILDVDSIGVRLTGSDDWNVDRLDVLYTGVDGGGNPTGGVLVERFGTPYKRLEGPVDEIVTPPVDWRPRVLADADRMIEQIHFTWDTNKSGPLDPNVWLVVNFHPETLSPGRSERRRILLENMDSLVGDPDGGGLASGTWNLLTDPDEPGPIRYGDIATITAFATAQDTIIGYEIEVREIDLTFTEAGGALGVFVDGGDPTAVGDEPFWIRKDRRTALLWRGLPPPHDIGRVAVLATPLKHLFVEVQTGDDNLNSAENAFLDFEFRDGRSASLELAEAGVHRFDGGSFKTRDLHLPFDDLLIEDLVSVRLRAPGFAGGVSGDNWDIQRLEVFRAGDPMARWLEGYGEANWVMAGDPSFPPDPANPPDPSDPFDPTRYGQGFVAIGTDFNGFSPQMPYADSEDPGSQPPPQGTPLLLPGPYSGAVGSGDFTLGRTFGFEQHGLAHYGMIKDFASKMYARDPYAADSFLPDRGADARGLEEGEARRGFDRRADGADRGVDRRMRPAGVQRWRRQRRRRLRGLPARSELRRPEWRHGGSGAGRDPDAVGRRDPAAVARREATPGRGRLAFRVQSGPNRSLGSGGRATPRAPRLRRRRAGPAVRGRRCGRGTRSRAATDQSCCPPSSRRDRAGRRRRSRGWSRSSRARRAAGRSLRPA